MVDPLGCAGRLARWCSLAAGVIVLGACAVEPRSSRMTGGDLDAISKALAGNLAASPVLADRTVDSPLMVIAITKVRNLTSDVMTSSEQWAVMAGVRSSLPIKALWDRYNVRFVIPAERTRGLRQKDGLGDAGEHYGRLRRPTHDMTATFRSITRADGEHRTDLYYCEFQLLDLASGEPVWSDRFEYKRSAAGHIWD